MPRDLRSLLPALLVALLPCTVRAEAESEPSPASRWCAPELRVIQEGVCAYAPPKDAKPRFGSGRTLILFLHSLIGQGSSWQWEQQRMMARMAKQHGVSALMPRGRGGLGPGRDPKVLAWPTSQNLTDEHEDSLVREWLAAKKSFEETEGKFDRMLVFGFSNGAYYATSLALRGRLKVDGFGIFAGGSGGKYSQYLAKGNKRRVPIFVGYGTKDPDHPRQESLVRLLRELGWPHASKAARIGHTVSDAQVRSALQFLTGEQPRAGDG